MKTPEYSIAVGFWEAFGEWTPNTPAIMAKVAIKALEREGWIVVARNDDPSAQVGREALNESFRD